MKKMFEIRNETNPESDAVKVQARSFRRALDILGHGVWKLIEDGKIRQRWQTFYGRQLPDGSYSHSDVFIVTKL